MKVAAMEGISVTNIVKDPQEFKKNLFFNNASTFLKQLKIIVTTQDLHQAMKMLGLNPSDQEVVDIPNIIAR